MGIRSWRKPLASIGLGASLLSACGGSTTPSASLPADELALLDLAPSDAFFVARLDGRAIRALPSWEHLEAQVEGHDPGVHAMIEGLDRLYVAVGGLVEAPPIPSNVDQEGNWHTRPTWAEVAEAFGGRIPSGVVIVEGSVSSLCDAALSEVQTRESGGYRYGEKDGIVVATRSGHVCALTFAPLFDRLVADTGRPSVAVSRLAGLADHGDFGIATAALEIDSPAFRSLVEGVGPDPERDSDSSRWVPAMRRTFAALVQGLDAVEWQVRRGEGAYESRTRLQASDHDRGIMWRELTDLYIEIVRAWADSRVGPEEGREQVRAMFDSTRIQPTDDGYVILSRVDEQMVERMFHDAIPDPANDVLMPDPNDAEEQSLVYSVGGGAAEVVSTVEGRAAELAALSPNDRWTVSLALAEAYSSLGRFDDAERALADAKEAIPASDYPLEQAGLGLALCRVKLDRGDASAAREAAVATLASCEASTCGSYGGELLGCRGIADAALGHADEGLAAIDEALAAESGSTPQIVAARAWVLAYASRLPEAAATARAICAGETPMGFCADLRLLEIEIAARGTGALGDVLASIDRSADFLTSNGTGIEREDAEVRLATARCEARSRRAPTTDEARSDCSEALERATTIHGGHHPRTAAAAVAYARVLKARRDASALTTALRTADAALEGLGPNLLVRADRAALGGQRAGGQPRR